MFMDEWSARHLQIQTPNPMKIQEAQTRACPRGRQIERMSMGQAAAALCLQSDNFGSVGVRRRQLLSASSPSLKIIASAVMIEVPWNRLGRATIYVATASSRLIAAL